MKFKNILILLLFFYSLPVCAQQLHINSINTLTGFYRDTISIAGSGFGSNPEDVSVHFGAGKAEVVYADDKLLKVLVPMTATRARISVGRPSLHIVTHFHRPFTPTYRTANFDFSKMNTNLQLSAEEEELYDICSCDFDQDGDVDVATTNNSTAASLSSVSVYANTSSAPGNIGLTRVAGTYFNINQPARNLTCSDVNGDGKPDLIVSQGGSVAENIYLFINESSSSPAVIRFASPLILNTEVDGQTNGIRRLLVHDLDGDALPEIIVTNETASQLVIFKNKSTAGAASFPPNERYFLNLPTNTLGLHINDIDGDRKADLITNANLGETLFVIRNLSQAGNLEFAEPTSFPLSGQLANLSSGDIDGDGKEDVVITDFEDGAILLLLNQSTPGQVVFGTPIRMNAALQPWGIQLADISGNGKKDIIVATLASSDKVVILKNNSIPGDPNFELIQVGNSSVYRNLNIADYNNDSRTDIMTTEKDFSGNFFITYLQNNSCIQPVISPAQPPAICESQPVRLSVSQAEGVTYQWFLNGSPIANADSSSIMAAIAGSYTVTVSDSHNGCNESSAAVAVVEDSGTIPDAPAISVPSVVCEGSTLNLSVADDPNLTYLWTGPEGFSSTETSPSISNVTTANAGEYQLEIKQGLCKGAVIKFFVDIAKASELGITPAGNQLICKGDSVTLSLEGNSLLNYQWYKDNQPISGANSSSFEAKEAGSYYLQAENQSGCLLQSNVVELSLNDQEAAFQADKLLACAGDSITFSSSINTGSGLSYAWDFGDGNTASTAEARHVYSSAGTYTVWHTVTNTASGCGSTSSTEIVILDAPEVEMTATNTSICEGDTVLLEAVGDFVSLSWDDGSTELSRSITSGGTYSFTAINEAGCTQFLEVTIAQQVRPQLIVEVDGSERISRGDSVQLFAFGADYYEWSPGVSLSDSTVSNPYTKPLSTTTYTVTGFDSEGCSSTAEITIFVEVDQLNIAAAKVFSPNQDDIDDTWVVEGIELYPDCYFIIFDLQGREVYRSGLNYYNDWEGINHQGQPLASGVYYYVFRCGDETNKGSGSVTILK
ncbi:MAG: FG-GAP-like repeat-containing protein [Cyclobacteriaceae bacterium]